jgi:hypothetical protein
MGAQPHLITTWSIVRVSNYSLHFHLQVSDIYKIPGLTDNDVKNFKKYEKYFTVNPPGRSFYERINNRVST